MKTPIADFVRDYQNAGIARLHMPGHKGVGFLGCEALDITEVQGADSLYHAQGVIAQSEESAAALFGAGRTLYSTEGSSQCIRAMLYLAVVNRPAGSAPMIVAARNVHKSFVHAAALVDFETVWLWPESDTHTLCGCPISAETVEKTLRRLPAPPAAVYVTCPDYLGGMTDVAAIAEVCHRHGTCLLVDNAHGAYLRFLQPSRHPLDLGADMCCDSAHKTLPVLTGGAYLHISKDAPGEFARQAKDAMALFGSTSPSYLTMISLDLCNRYLEEEYSRRLLRTAEKIEAARQALHWAGWQTEDTDPLRLTILVPEGMTGEDLAQKLRENGAECEYADPDFLVLMLTPENDPQDIDCVVQALGKNQAGAKQRQLPLAKAEQVCSVRQALFAPHETVAAKDALGRICGAPTVGCPPAIPIAVSGERIGEEALELFRYYDVEFVDVLK